MMRINRVFLGVLVLVAAFGFVLPGTALAVDFSFTGNFSHDDNVQLFNFTADGISPVTLESLSYAGGTNAAGQVIARGGFDPILALFDSTGNLIGQDDDTVSGTPGACGVTGRPADPATGAQWDTCFQEVLGPGTYTVSIMEYNNFANGPNLSDGFVRQGQGDFTPGLTGCGASAFCDVSGTAGNVRDSHWAFDILNVAQAAVVPEPGTLLLFGSGLLGLGGFAWRRNRK